MILHAKILVVKNGAVYDMSHLVSKIVWRGRKGASSRTLDVTFIDDDGYKRDRTGLNVEEGHSVIFSWKGEELFRGMFIMQEQSRRKTLTAKAYDVGIRLANNKDTFCYTNKTATDIFVDVCGRFGIPTSEVADTGYVIPELPKPKTTGWDVVCDALALTYKATGVRYYPTAQGEKMSLLERRKNILQWVVETGINLEEYSLTKSIERVRTRIVLLSSEGEVLARAQNDGLEQKIGIFQELVSIDDEMNNGQLEQLVNTTLAENNESTQNLTVKALGQVDVISGRGVFVNIKPLDISKSFYVESDTHTFDRRYHSMALDLTPATDTQAEKPETERDTEIKVGDTVNFAGGPHYVSSNAGQPAGGTRRGGPAKCTLINPGAKWPYHLIGGAYTDVDGNSNVYGWVAAELVSK